jgi:hypothetical protein
MLIRSQNTLLIFLMDPVLFELPPAVVVIKTKFEIKKKPTFSRFESIVGKVCVFVSNQALT